MWTITLCLIALQIILTPAASADPYLSPVALRASPDGQTLYIAQRTADRVAVFNVNSEKVTSLIKISGAPTDLALSENGAQLFVTVIQNDLTGSIAVIDTKKSKVTKTIDAGHAVCGPSLSADGKTLYVCNRFDDDVSIISTGAGKEVARVPVVREPIASALTPNGRRLIVANHLPDGRADVAVMTSMVSIIDTKSKKVVAEIALPNGSQGLRSVAISSDGKLAYVSHILSRFHMPTTQLERGWMNTNALSVIDVTKGKLVNTVLLDSVDRGAANPWGVALTEDGKQLVVAHAGTHEISVIDAPAMLAKLDRLANPDKSADAPKPSYSQVSRTPEDVPNDLSFLVDVRRRIPLTGNGPRGIAVIGSMVYAGEYFSDTLSLVDINPEVRPRAKSLAIGPTKKMDDARKGERYFNDAAFCFQGWQSCGSCHPDTRADALNWDLLNDGMGNPKNTKSLLLAHKTAPSMWTGVRADAPVGVRAGIRFIQFAVRPEEDAAAIDAYLEGLAPDPSPFLVNGKLTKAAERGKKLFEDGEVGCAHCHSGKYFTDREMYDVGTHGELDQDHYEFDTPHLNEVWRTAPYLHDGRSVTLRDVLKTDNHDDSHGTTSHLTEKQIDDLIEYLKAL